MVHLRHLFADCQVVVFSFKADTYDLTDENGKATRRLHGKVAVFSFNADTYDLKDENGKEKQLAWQNCSLQLKC